jgi:hypothetical protein
MGDQRPDRTGSERLAEALRQALTRGEAAPPPSPHDVPGRLAALEREVGEARTRVNAPFFAVLTVALTDVFARAVL